MNELERVALLAKAFSSTASRKGIRTGIGDDAAVLDSSAESLVWTIDAQIEGTHFRLDWLTWEDVGWRSFMAAASDLAAMGAEPVAALSALALPPAFDDSSLEALARGQAAAAEAIQAPIVGGNLARASTETSVTTTLLGKVDRAILRAGAQPGDRIYIAGALGVAAAGLALLQSGKMQDACVEAWRRPRTLIDHGRTMRASATSAVDISDGLTRDAMHVAEASQVTLVLDEAALRSHANAALHEAAKLLNVDALEWMLGGGEDYALFVTSPAPIAGFTEVGVVEAGPARLLIQGDDASRRDLEARGFDHFR